MDLLSERIKKIEPSMTLSLTAKAKELKDAGKNVCSFAAGEPDSDTADNIKAAAARAMGEGLTKYTPVAGLPELRAALSQKLYDDNDISYKPNQICVSSGAKQACYNTILAICDAGDEVIVPAPYWTSYPDMIKLAGATPIIVETDAESAWKITPEQFESSITPLTKMIIINSPSNPTGAVYSKAELHALAKVAKSEDIVILSDEIYEKLVYDEAEHVSPASLDKDAYELTVTVNGFSKAYSMTGWRLGYSAAPIEIARAIENIQGHTTSNATSFAQAGALEAVTGDQQMVEDMREEFDMRRRYMLGRFAKIRNLGVVEPKGAFYCMVDIGKFGLSSTNFAEKLLSRYHVVVIPGIAFGNDKTLRFSYASSLDIIKTGLDRFARFCKEH